jgi:hypothetical protein
VVADFRGKCWIGKSSAVGHMDEDEAGDDEERNTKFELHFCADFDNP